MEACHHITVTIFRKYSHSLCAGDDPVGVSPELYAESCVSFTARSHGDEAMNIVEKPHITAKNLFSIFL